MRRKLLIQMCNEWRTNIWMGIELLIVAVVLFVLADKIYVNLATINEPLGFNVEHCYLLDVRMLSEASPDYIDYPDEDAATTDLLKLLDRLKARPEIAAAAISLNSYPYNGNNSSVQVDIDTFSMADMPMLYRRIEPDFFEVFRIEGAEGESSELLAEVLKRNKVLLTDNALHVKAGIKSLKPYYGKQIVLRDNDDTLELRTAVKPMRYSDYASAYGYGGSTVFTLLPRYLYPYANEVTVRVRDNLDKDFAETLMADADGYLRVGNWYIASVRSFDSIRDLYNSNAEAETRNTIVCALFLLVNIFLGILGTFWFRTRQRMKEIALRMACGATRGDIFRRILGEGELLLLFVTPVAVAIDYGITHYEFNTWYQGGFFEPLRFIVCVLIAWALLAVMVAIGIYFPARRGMGIHPAIALKSE